MMHNHNQLSFVTLSNLVLDELHFPNKDPLVDVVGGPGGFAIVGARLFSPAERAKDVGWLIYAGSDFPGPVEELVKSWDLTLRILKDPEKNSTRGRLTYHDSKFEDCTFQEISPPLILSPIHFRQTELLGASTFHLLGTPQMLFEQAILLRYLRDKDAIHDPFCFIWEPESRCCYSENLDMVLCAARLVDVFSPNHLELCRLFGQLSKEVSDFSRSKIEEHAAKVLASGVGNNRTGCVVIRAAEHGCLVMSRSQPARWLPAYYRPPEHVPNASRQREFNVVDATGAGNTFLGSFAIGWQKTSDIIQAAMYGNVGASFAIEQIGVPVRHAADNATKELWNGTNVQSRLAKYVAMLEASGLP